MVGGGEVGGKRVSVIVVISVVNAPVVDAVVEGIIQKVDFSVVIVVGGEVGGK